jgi:choline dehydrogenase-like flavoprotein
VETMFHPVSACRMGLNPDRDVVNVWLRMPGNGELSLV